MREGKFYLDFLEGHTFEGYTQDEKWNGFACPYFTYDQAMNIVTAWQGTGTEAYYDPNSDSFYFKMADSSDEVTEDRFEAVRLHEMKLYPIGAFSWIWDEESINETLV